MTLETAVGIGTACSVPLLVPLTHAERLLVTHNRLLSGSVH